MATKTVSDAFSDEVLVSAPRRQAVTTDLGLVGANRSATTCGIVVASSGSLMLLLNDVRKNPSGSFSSFASLLQRRRPVDDYRDRWRNDVRAHVDKESPAVTARHVMRAVG